MELKETRGMKARYEFPDFEINDTIVYTATDPDDLRDGVATYAYANKVTTRVINYSKRKGYKWKVARRTFGANVEITRLA